MELMDKLTILAESAKYDVSCCSSGTERKNTNGGIGNAAACGICHSFAADGRCISLLKILMTNVCIYNCSYCINRRENDIVRAAFSPEEIAELTIGFYRRNYIEGLFLSSGIVKNSDHTTELLIKAVTILREKYLFNGYIHVKAIPGTSPELINRLGMLVDRMSANIELPSEESLKKLAPDKSKHSLFSPILQIRNGITENKSDIIKYNHAQKFVPSGQSTQMIIGATPESDLKIITLSEALYSKYKLKRVYYSAYVPVQEASFLPSLDTKPPLLREHRLYQADWLLRFYGFSANELLDNRNPNFNPLIDPKCNWALNNLHLFPIEVNTAPKEILLRVPGIGVTSTNRILSARRQGKLDYDGLKRLGVVLKRAKFFITCMGKRQTTVSFNQEKLLVGLLSDNSLNMLEASGYSQLSFIEPVLTSEDVRKCLTGQL